MKRGQKKANRTDWNEERARQALKLRYEKHNYQEIADIMNDSYNSVASFFTRYRTDKTFFLADEKKKRQAIRKVKMIGKLTGKPKTLQIRGDLVAKIKDDFSPLMLAQIHLGNRFVDTGRKFYLDGQEVGLNDVIRATNIMLVNANMPQITNNPAWKVNC